MLALAIQAAFSRCDVAGALGTGSAPGTSAATTAVTNAAVAVDADQLLFNASSLRCRWTSSDTPRANVTGYEVGAGVPRVMSA